MIDANKINELYKTISNDLNITRFNNESEESFRCRLVYSGIGKWILTLFSDRDFEESEFEQVSKTHVTITAMNVIDSYEKIDPSLSNYFTDHKKLINLIENIYLKMGYVNSGFYSFKKQNRMARVAIGKKCLVIDDDGKKRKMRGLGFWGDNSNTNVSLSDYLLSNESAHDYTKKLISQLKFIKFDAIYGKNEIYNIERNRWEFYSEKLLDKYAYLIVKIDNGLDYKILKKMGNDIYGASIPVLYTNQSNDFNFFHEVWRFILGICSIDGLKAKCYFKKYNDYIKIRFGGFILPSQEEAILKCMCWPLNDCLNSSEFITDISMESAIINLLNRLSIDIVVEELSDGK